MFQNHEKPDLRVGDKVEVSKVVKTTGKVTHVYPDASDWGFQVDGEITPSYLVKSGDASIRVIERARPPVKVGDTVSGYAYDKLPYGTILVLADDPGALGDVVICKGAGEFVTGLGAVTSPSCSRVIVSLPKEF